MKYVDYLKTLEINGEIFFPETEYEITNEGNMNIDHDKVQLIVNDQMGSMTEGGGGILTPIMIRVLTDDLETTKDKLQEFVTAQNLSKKMVDNEYLQEFYYTPYVSQTFLETGTNYKNELVLNGTIIVTTGIQEIKEVYVDGALIESSLRLLTYATEIESSSKGNASLNNTNVKRANVKLNITAVSKSDSYLSTIRRQVMLGNIPIDKTYTIKCVYIDDSEETYSMKLISISLNSDNNNLPSLSIEFM